MTVGAATLGVVAVFFACVNARPASAKPDKQVAIVCVDPDYYREQAAHFRQLAAAVSGDGFMNQMMELAAAYEARAAQLEAQR
jgi:hypothetical protein